MTTISVVRPNAKRKWYGLALRHLRMASRLLDSGFADGATFHAYHAYECVLSSFIAAHGYLVPPEGWTKITRPSGKAVLVYPLAKRWYSLASPDNYPFICFNGLAFQRLAEPDFDNENAYRLLFRMLNSLLIVS